MRAPAAWPRRSSAASTCGPSGRRSASCAPAASPAPPRPVRRAVGRRCAPACTSPGGGVASTAATALPAAPRRRPAAGRPAARARRRAVVDGDDAEGFTRRRAPVRLRHHRRALPARRARPRRATALLAVACDGRADDDAGLTLGELAEALVALGAAHGDQPRRRRLDVAGLRRAAAQRAARGSTASSSPAAGAISTALVFRRASAAPAVRGAVRPLRWTPMQRRVLIAPDVLPARRVGARRPRAGHALPDARLGRHASSAGSLPRRPRRRRALLRAAWTSRPVDFERRRRADAPVLRGPPRRAGPRLRRRRRRGLRARTSTPGRARWSDAGAADADVLHLHHLTPLHEAAARVAPDVPVVDHLHGTELLMLEADRRRRAAAGPHAEAWARAHAPLGAGAASGCCVLSPRAGRARAQRCSASTPSAASSRPNGFDPELFDRARRRPRRALAPAPRRRAARLAARRGRGQRRLRRRRRSRRCARGPVAALRRALHRGQAPRRCSSAPCARPRRASPRRALAGPRRRLPGRVGGRAPAATRSPPPARATSSSPAGTTTTSCRSSCAPPTCSSLASVREQFGSVLVEGDGLRAARRSPSTATARRTSSTTARTGWLVEPDDEARWPRALRRGARRPGRAPRAAAARPARRARALLVARRWRALAGVLDEVAERVADVALGDVEPQRSTLRLAWTTSAHRPGRAAPHRPPVRALPRAAAQRCSALIALSAGLGMVSPFLLREVLDTRDPGAATRRC